LMPPSVHPGVEAEIHCLRRADPRWPVELNDIEGPPERLWARGNYGLLARQPRVAIVGSRGPSAYGLEQSRRFAADLASRGAVIISGMARGIDATAHQAALDVGGATIAVLGCGVDRPWPAGALAERMATEGLLLSELEPGTPPAKRNFPLRNRIISGLAQVVLVVEAAYRSGSLITARWAADQGREVLVLPGRVDQPLARGCHRLLREGAGLVEDPGEIAELLALGDLAAESGGSDDPHQRSEPALLAALVGETPTAAELASRLGQQLPDVLAELARLELEGRVARVPGGFYRRLSEGRRR